MTLVEFLQPLRGGTHQDRVLAVLYFRERYEGNAGLTVEQVRQGLKAARAPGWMSANIADVLNKSVPWADTSGLSGARRVWQLTDSGRAHVRTLLGLPEQDPEVEHDASSLLAIIAKVGDPDAKDYLEEALKCLRVGALRATVVFLWSAAIRTVQSQALKAGTGPLNIALQAHDPKARHVSRLDHFAYIKDATTLLAARDLGVLDKSEKDTLGEALDLRNRCGHPSKYKPGIKKVSGFIEDVVSVVFS